MDKLHTGLLAVAAIAAAVGVNALRNAGAWESRAHAAEVYVQTQDQVVDSLQAVATKAEANAAHVDTVRVTLTKLIVRTDSVSRPDSTCGPSLAIRDKALSAAGDEVLQWQHAFHAQVEALATLQAEKDTLQHALKARPHTGLALELLHPSVHISLQAMVYPQPRIGIGLSIDLARFRL